MTEVMIVGNGISRLAYAKEITNYPGELWACNRAYTEFGDRLARLTGHPDVLAEAAKYRDDHGLSFEIWTNKAQKINGAKCLSVGEKWRRDSGTTLVAQALHEGKRVVLVGFDLGGPDIHSPNHETAIKDVWVYRWREIIAEWSPDRIRWIGHDHTPFLVSGKHPRKYSAVYMAGGAHINTSEYHEVFESFTGRPAIAPSVNRPAEVKRKFKVCYMIGHGAGLFGVVSERVARAMEARGEAKIIMEVSK